jgi:hypothetical protein
MVTMAVTLVALTNVVELTVMPVLEKAAVAPVAKPVPVIVTLLLTEPRGSAAGVIAVTVRGPVTLKTPVPNAAAPPGSVTVTLRAPTAAVAAMVMLAVTLVALTNVVEFTVMPLPENTVVAPVAKPVPVMVTFWAVVPWASDAGLTAVIVPDPVTVKRPVPDATPPPVLVTVTLLKPRVAVGAIVTSAVTSVELTKVVERTVMPALEKEATAPLAKPTPVIVKFCPTEP